MSEAVKAAAEASSNAEANQAADPAKANAKGAEPPKADTADGKAALQEANKEQAKADSPTEQKPVVPEKYDLKLPEGSLLDPTAIERIAAYAKAQGLSNEQAQAVLEREHGAVSSYAEAQKRTLEAKRDEWMQQATSDKEIGGEAFKENVEHAKRALDRFGSDILRKTLEETGLGNHPELVRAFSRVGKAMADDRMIHAGTQAQGQPSIEDRWYPNMKKEQ